MMPMPQCDSLSTEQILKTVADPQCREVLRYLVVYGESPLAVEELAQRIADDKPPITGEPPAHRLTDDTGEPAAERVDTVEAITTQLHHVHLPKLAASGVIDYDAGSQTVRYRSHDVIKDLLQFIATKIEESQTAKAMTMTAHPAPTGQEDPGDR